MIPFQTPRFITPKVSVTNLLIYFHEDIRAEV